MRFSHWSYDAACGRDFLPRQANTEWIIRGRARAGRWYVTGRGAALVRTARTTPRCWSGSTCLSWPALGPAREEIPDADAPGDDHGRNRGRARSRVCAPLTHHGRSDDPPAKADDRPDTGTDRMSKVDSVGL